MALPNAYTTVPVPKQCYIASPYDHDVTSRMIGRSMIFYRWHLVGETQLWLIENSAVAKIMTEVVPYGSHNLDIAQWGDNFWLDLGYHVGHITYQRYIDITNNPRKALDTSY